MEPFVFDREEARLVFHRALAHVLNDQDLKARWVNGDQYEKNLVISHVVFRQTWDKAFSDGYDDGGDDAREYAAVAESLNNW